MTLDTNRGLPFPDFDDEPSAAEPGDAEPSDALEVGVSRTGVAPLPPRRRAASSAAQRRRIRVVGAVILAAIGFLVFKGLTSAIVFFKTANEAVAQRTELGNADFQMEGTVVHGSVRHLRSDIYRFAVVSFGVAVNVENTGDPPQMFRPGLPVVLVGHFVGSSDLFASDEIMVKHSAAYIAAHPGRVKASSGSSP